MLKPMSCTVGMVVCTCPLKVQGEKLRAQPETLALQQGGARVSKDVGLGRCRAVRHHALCT